MEFVVIITVLFFVSFFGIMIFGIAKAVKDGNKNQSQNGTNKQGVNFV